jgi:hypothetical protein
MQTNFNLPEKYAEMGYELSKVGDKSLALRFQGHLIMLFSGIDASDGFVSRLCDCHLKSTSNEKIISYI